jgi:hypothetical protein
MADKEEVEDMPEEVESRVAHSKEIKEIVLYIVFMFFFTIATTGGLFDTSNYIFGNVLKESLTGVVANGTTLHVARYAALITSRSMVGRHASSTAF